MERKRGLLGVVGSCLVREAGYQSAELLFRVRFVLWFSFSLVMSLYVMDVCDVLLKGER